MNKFIYLFISFQLTIDAYGKSNVSDILSKRYSLYDFKMLKIRALQSTSHAILDKPKDTFEYLDSIYQYIGRFEDTHLRVGEAKQRPIIFNGLDLVLVNGKVFVKSINKKLLKQNKRRFPKEKYDEISIGDEVISINKKNVIKDIKQLGEMIPSSSSHYRLKLATQTLSQRRFFYPKKNRFIWKLRSSKIEKNISINLPFYVNEKELKSYPDAKTVLDRAKIIKTNLQASISSPDEILSCQTKFKLLNEKKWGKTGLVTGMLKINHLLVPYVKFDEFSNVKLSNKNFSTFDAMSNFTNKEKSKNIIVDLRYNGGGSGELGNKLFEKLVYMDSPVFYWTTKYRNTKFYKDLYSHGRKKFISAEMRPIDKMFKEDSPYSVFSFKFVKGRNKLKRNIILLVSSACISTCDIFTRLMKKAGAVIIGRPTNGTGSGFNFGGKYKFWNSPSNLFSIRIPVYVIGPSGKKGNLPPISSSLQAKYLVENTPVFPHQNVDETWNEYFLDDMKNWKAAINKSLVK